MDYFSTTAHQMEEKHSLVAMEAIKTAQSYKDELQHLRVELNEINNQLTKSAENSISEIEDTFQALVTSLLSSIETRKQHLIGELRTLRDDAISSLHDCESVIDGQMKITSDVLDLGKKIVSTEDESRISEDDLIAFNDRCYSMRCLPDVPKPTDVPFISVRFNRSIVDRILSKVSSFGRISVMGPVQIVESKEKPGALAIRWEEDEVRMCCESSSRKYVLQSCLGDARKDESVTLEFVNIYIGYETCYVVRNLRAGVNYSFRVRHHGNEECDWSVPYVAKTNVSPYEWDGTNENYFLTYSNRIATKVSSTLSMVYSINPQFECGHSMQLRILEMSSSSDQEGLGLSLTNCRRNETPISPGTIFVNIDGYVFVDGKKMTNRLPKLYVNSLLAFESEEELTNNKMRVMITCDDKQVTYDWRLDQESEFDTHPNGVYFFMVFQDSGWKVSVE